MLLQGDLVHFDLLGHRNRSCGHDSCQIPPHIPAGTGIPVLQESQHPCVFLGMPWKDPHPHPKFLATPSVLEKNHSFQQLYVSMLIPSCQQEQKT